MKKLIKNWLWHITEKLQLGEIRRQTAFHRDLAIEDFKRQHLYQNPLYADPKCLLQFEFGIYSQGGEDGIIAEIFKRIGLTNKFFIEFGVSNGLENNTAALLLQGWQGVWLEGSLKFYKSILQTFSSVISSQQLQVRNAFVSRENIETLLMEAGAPAEPDLLSIDIDGNDYWIWQTITKFRPQVVVIEYNAFFGPTVPWIMEYDANHIWDRSTHYGASLKALEKLGRDKGYSLVACNFTGHNAFFVRDDLVSDKFLTPFTAENHYQALKLYLLQPHRYPRLFRVGH